MSKVSKILLALVVLLILIQFIPMDKTNPPVVQANDFITINKAPAHVAKLMKNACYDCHSNESVYPFYTKVQPIGWWIRGHIRGARQALNFSEWASYSSDKQTHKLEECIEEIEEKEMPLKSYTLIHKEAQLSQEDRQALVRWLSQL